MDDKYLLRTKRLIGPLCIGYMYKIEGDDFNLRRTIFGTSSNKVHKKALAYIQKRKDDIYGER